MLKEKDLIVKGTGELIEKKRGRTLMPVLVLPLEK